MRFKPIRVDILRKGEVIYTSKSLVDAQLFTNISTTSINNMIKHNIQIRGFTARYHEGEVIIPSEDKDAVTAKLALLEHEYGQSLKEEKNAAEVLKALTVIRRNKAYILNAYIAKIGKGE